MNVIDTKHQARGLVDRVSGLFRAQNGSVDSDLVSKNSSEWLALIAIVYSAVVEAHPHWGLQPLGLEWIAMLMGWGAKSSFAYASKRRQDSTERVAKHKVDADAAAFERAAQKRVTGAPGAVAPAVGETLRPGQVPVLPTTAPIVMPEGDRL